MNGLAKRTVLIRLFCGVLIIFSLLAAMKMMLLGLHIDEEYAIAMSYRMAEGDRMLLEMWEPHQTSGFVCALLIKGYMALFQSKEYLVFFLRGMGVLMQAGVSAFVYTTLRRRYSFTVAFVAALITFNVLPKWTLVPEFSNMLLWCSLCTWMCLLRYAEAVETGTKWLVLGALFHCGMVLAYPTCLLVFPIYLLGLYLVTEPCHRKKIWIFPCCCVLVGVLYLVYFLSHMSMTEFLFGLRQMMTDGKHSYGLLERLNVYGQEIIRLIPPLLGVLIPAAMAGMLWGGYAFSGALVLVACLQQMYFWLGPNPYFNQPLIVFYLVYAVGALCRKRDRTLFWLGYVPAGITLLAVLLLTNTSIGVSGVQLLPGMLCACIILLQEAPLPLRKGVKVLGTISCLALLALFMFAKGWLVCETEGYKADALFVKQKALCGAARNIYCRYTDGYQYNALSELLEGRVTEKDSVLYVGFHSLRYLLTDAKISTYSTISTPTFDERLLTYWERYPERYPTVIIVEKGCEDWEDIRSFFDLKETGWQTEEIEIYVTE